MPEATSAERVVVCGLGHVGYRVARLLSELGVGVVVIAEQARSEWSRLLGAAGVEIVRGDARDDVVLAKAGIADSGALIGAADVDLLNLEIALDVRRLRPDLKLILRVFDRDLARSLEQSFGNTRALGASALASPVMAFASLGRLVTAAFELAGHPLLVANVTLDEASPLIGKTMQSMRERFGVVVVGGSGTKSLSAGNSVTLIGTRSRFVALGLIAAPVAPAGAEKGPGFWAVLSALWSNAPRPLRTVFLTLIALTLVSVVVFRFAFDPPISLVEAIYYTATTVTTTGYGDITPRTSGTLMMLYSSLFMVLGSVTMAVLYSFVTSYVVSEQLRTELGRPPMPRDPHVIVVGMGNVGYRTWDELVRAGHGVVAVDSDGSSEFMSVIRARGPHAIGDSRLTATLAAAGVAHARALVATTGDDAVNLAVALAARRVAPGIRTVVRVFDADFAQKLEDSGLVDVAVSTSLVAAPSFVAAALYSDVVGASADEHGLVAYRAGAVPEAWAGRSPSELGIEIPFVVEGDDCVAWDPDAALPKGAQILSLQRRPFVAAPGGVH